ncbi:unnamed protein product [Paramecium primaurelia]|uniref:Protein kinase domain-containing protein n=1 Tax=Paramecium primaurelia TaxID=5886 RepID=A0A8S1P8V6_PARPR|nr:unnamed protein product [Paramecium primaurelia]
MASQNNLIQKGNYIIDFERDLIAQGKKGPILRCRRKDCDQYFCVKVINKSQNKAYYQSEIDALFKLKQSFEKNPNVLRIYDIIEENDKFYIFTDFCISTFEKYLEQRWNTITLNSDEINDFLSQIVRGYQQLRKLKISVRDFTPKTILVQKLLNDRIVLKITDYSINYQIDTEIADAQTRTPYYKAPELFLANLDKIKSFESCDIYSLGVILYMMCFKGENLMKFGNFNDLSKFHEELRVKRAFQLPKNTFCQQELSQLLSQMIVYNPEDRISWDQLESMVPPKFVILKEIFFVDFKQTLGQGAQGVTHITYDLTNNEQFVCKVIQNKNLGTSREIQIFEQIKGKNNENVIKIFELIKQTQFTYLIMEKCDISMQSYLEQKQQSKTQLDQKEILDILYQIVEGYCFLKQIGVIHRDLKPDNILFKKNKYGRNIVKIIDFGVGKIIGKDYTRTEAGTPLYAAPEVLEQGKAYNYQCDIYSLGVILFNLAFLKMFKDIRSRQDLNEFHKSLAIKPFECPNHQNPLITDLIKKMIVYDPIQRITWEQLQAHSIFDEVRQSLLSQSQQMNLGGNITEIYQYIYSLYLLALKLLTSCEECQKENLQFYDELLLFQQFIIRFQLTCMNCLRQLSYEEVINLSGIDFRITQKKNYSLWLDEIQFKKLFSSDLEKYSSLIKTKPINLTQIVIMGQEILKNQKNSVQDENQNINFLSSHQFFNQFYSLIRALILKSNLPIKFKYQIQKFSDVFIEYPIQNFNQYSHTKLTLKICLVNQMEQYIENQLKLIL